MDELYSFNKTLDRVRTEECDQTKFMKDMKNLTDENHTKTLIIKTLTENLNTINKEKFITNNQNLNKINVKIQQSITALNTQNGLLLYQEKVI